MASNSEWDEPYIPWPLRRELKWHEELFDASAKLIAGLALAGAVYSGASAVMENGHLTEADMDQIDDCAGFMQQKSYEISEERFPNECEPFIDEFWVNETHSESLNKSFVYYTIPAREIFLNAHSPIEIDPSKRSEKFEDAVDRFALFAVVAGVGYMTRRLREEEERHETCKKMFDQAHEILRKP